VEARTRRVAGRKHLYFVIEHRMEHAMANHFASTLADDPIVETICPKFRGNFYRAVLVEPVVARLEIARAAILHERLIRASEKALQYWLEGRRGCRRLSRRERRKGNE